MSVLGFYELPEEDQPPEQLWGNDDGLKQWFDEVKQRHKDRYGSRDDDLEDVPQMQNEYAREVLRNAR